MVEVWSESAEVPRCAIEAGSAPDRVGLPLDDRNRAVVNLDESNLLERVEATEGRDGKLFAAVVRNRLPVRAVAL